MTISLIVAMAHERVIGANNKLPWHLPADLKRFKQLTLNHPMIMGRKTHESIGRLLPGRTSIIVSRQQNYTVEGAFVVSSLEAAFTKAQASPGSEEIFVIGGSELFKQALPKAQRIYLTHIELDVAGDVYFPEIPKAEWRSLKKDFYPGTDETPAFLFETLERA